MAPTLHLFSLWPGRRPHCDLRRFYTFMKRINLFIHSCLILLTVTGVLLATPGSVQAQTMPPGPDDNLSRWQLASFDSFLDSHPEVAEQWRQNASRVTNEYYSEAHRT